MKKPLKKIPRFKTEDAERTFWATHDVTDYFDIEKAKRVTFPNLKPSTETISLRLPVDLLNHIKQFAHQRDIPYQSYMKYILFAEIKKERRNIQDVAR